MNTLGNDWAMETSPAEEGKVDVTINGTSYGKFDADASGEPIQTQIGAFSAMQLTFDDGETKGYIFTEDGETGAPMVTHIGVVNLDPETGKILVSQVGNFSTIHDTNDKGNTYAYALVADAKTGEPIPHSLGTVQVDDTSCKMLATEIGGFSVIQDANHEGRIFAYAVMEDPKTGKPTIEKFGKVDADAETGRIFVTKAGKYDLIQETRDDGQTYAFLVLNVGESKKPFLKPLGPVEVDATGKINLDAARLMKIVNKAVRDI